MNPSFFQLPDPKKQAILDAACEVFAFHSYRSACMNDIAWKAGISKSLLFYYFKNKRELYLYVWNEAARITNDALVKAHVFEAPSLLEKMELGLLVKEELMMQRPHLALFALRAFLERDPEVEDAIQASYASWFSRQMNLAIQDEDPKELIQGISMESLMEMMRLSAEGALFRLEKEGLDPGRILQESRKMIVFWKKVAGRKGENPHGSHS